MRGQLGLRCPKFTKTIEKSGSDHNTYLCFFFKLSPSYWGAPSAHAQGVGGRGPKMTNLLLTPQMRFLIGLGPSGPRALKVLLAAQEHQRRGRCERQINGLQRRLTFSNSYNFNCFYSLPRNPLRSPPRWRPGCFCNQRQRSPRFHPTAQVEAVQHHV